MKFEQYAEEANVFLREVAAELGNDRDTAHAHRVVTSVFHTLRDMITPEESTHLIAQLPMYLKAIYVDGWKMSVKNKIRTKAEFLQGLRSKSQPTAARDFGDDNEAIEKAKGVFRVLRNRVSTGELQHVIDQFPIELAGLWITESREREHA